MPSSTCTHSHPMPFGLDFGKTEWLHSTLLKALSSLSASYIHFQFNQKVSSGLKTESQ